MSDLPILVASPKRKRGAQPGNFNALKHGYYLSEAHLRAAAPLLVADLANVLETIVYIRGFVRRIYETDLHGAGLVEISGAINALDLSGIAIARLITLNKKDALHAHSAFSANHIA